MTAVAGTAVTLLAFNGIVYAPFREVSISLLSLWEPAFQIGGTEGAWLGDQLPSRIHLTPDVPQKHTAYPSVA